MEATTPWQNILSPRRHSFGKPLQIALITDRHDETVDSWPLKAAMEQKGMQVTVFEHPERAEIIDNGDSKILTYDGQPVDASQFDCVIQQTWGGDDPLAQNMQDLMVTQGAVAYCSTEAILTSFSKEASNDILAEHNIPFPESRTIHAAEGYDEAHIREQLNSLPNPPYVIKPDKGTQGKGVEVVQLTEEEKQQALPKAEVKALLVGRALPHIRNILESGDDVQLQEFIETRGAGQECVNDIRVLVIGGEIIDAVLRTGGEGSMTAGISTGGTASSVELTEEEKQMVLKTAEKSGLRVAGIDLLRDASAPGRSLIGEYNDAPMLRMHLPNCPDIYDKIAQDVDYITRSHQLGRTGASLPDFT